MKKNKALRTASGLMVLTLLTISIIGATFAKYTTTGSASDTARVAKWGVVIKTSGSLYSNTYADEKGGNIPAAWSKKTLADGISVQAAAETENIVAPGTKSYGNGLSFGISGTPEVAVSVTADITAEDIFLKGGTYGVLVPATVSDTESLKKAIIANADGVYAESATTGTYDKLAATAAYDAAKKYYVLTNKVTVTDDYYPVKYTLEGGTSESATTAAAIAKDLAKAIDSSAREQTGYKVTYNISKNFDANTDLGAAAGDAGLHFENEKLEWEWAFTGTDADAKDTILGDLIAARSAAVDYIAVGAGTGDAMTALTISTADKDYTVKKGNDVVANLNTQFDISLGVTQID